MSKPKCPRCEKESAIVDPTYGVLPGRKCQKDDAKVVVARNPQYYTIAKHSNIQDQRDKHDGDIIQPWSPGKDPKPNPDFIKAYPEKAQDYFTDEELEKM